MLYLAAVLFVADPLPGLEDRDRFPPLDACHSAIRAQLVRWDHARLRLVLEPHREPHWRREIIEADRAMEAWYALVQAHGGLVEEVCGDDSPETCLAGLELLKAIIGDEAYFLGRMP